MIYNPMNGAQLNTLAPQFEWVGYLKEAGLGEVTTVVALETTAITEAGKMLDSVPLSTWKEYVTFHFLRTHAEYLPKAFDDAHFKMFSTALRGIPEQRDRWKRGVQPPTWGSPSVASYLPPQERVNIWWGQSRVDGSGTRHPSGRTWRCGGLGAHAHGAVA